MSGLEVGFLPWEGLPSSPPAITPCCPSQGIALSLWCNGSSCDSVWWRAHKSFPIVFRKIQLSDTPVNLKNYFLQYLILSAIIISTLNERLLRTWGDPCPAETSVLISVVEPRMWMCALLSRQVPAGARLLPCCMSSAVAQMSKFEQRAYLKQSPQKGIKWHQQQ